ncbi:site-specific integrase [Lacibacter sp.]|uniref:site-specific integrase n=1 Tax=Lacibacter sp. TaxID=1915409 RepID=UPI002B4AC589|nr:site-specific integrase [Lacibacter sp.]HLP37099.1 site-specific integrase [Lacibacter sp.]
MANSNRRHSLDEISISFLLRNGYRLKNGEHPIVVKLVYLGERKEINTGLSISSNHWISGSGMVDSTSKNASFINKELAKLSIKVEEQFNSMKRILVDFTLDELIDRLKGKAEPPQTLMDYVNLMIKDFESRVGVDLSITTLYKYKRTARYLLEYLQVKRSQKNLPVSRVNKDFLEGFFKFLRKEKANSHNSSSALMNCLKTILEEPVKLGVIRHNPFRDLSLTRKPVNREYLTTDEIKLLQKLENLSPAMERNRDIFLLACFTGLAYSDIKDLKRIHIIVDPNGEMHIEKYRTKSTVLSYIPLIKAAENILLKYSPTEDCRDFQWLIPCNQKLNLSLKTIGKLAGIDRKLFMHLARHTFATTVTLSQGVPIESVSKMLGHTTLKHTQLYAKIVNSKVDKDMEKVRNIF